MWFSSSRKTRRGPVSRSLRGGFRAQLEALEDRCLLSAGALDPTFGSDGLVSGPSYSVGPVNYAASVVVYPVQGTPNDGKIVASCPAIGANASFGLARYNADGSPDTTFGAAGIVSTAVGTQNSVIQGLALQTDGKIVAVGHAYVYSQYSNHLDSVFAVARYNPSGTLDTTFGVNHDGIVLTNVVTQTKKNLSGYEAPDAVTIQGDGKIIVVGFSNHGGSTDAIEDFTVVRYKADGTLDTSFGFSHNGIVVTPNFGSSGGDQCDFPYAVALQTDGKIVVSGDAFPVSTLVEPGMAVVRYTAGGLLDTTFGTNGKVLGLAASDKAGGRGVLVQSNGAIVVAGSMFHTGSPGGSSDGQVLARLNSTGQLDTTFGSSGFVRNSSIASCWGIAQAANGDLLAAGTAGDPNNSAAWDLGVAAYLPGGAPDTSFGTNGATAGLSGGIDRARALAIQGDGKIVVEGISTSTSGTTSISLARFQVDYTFTISPNPVSAGSLVSLTASNLLNTDPNNNIIQVASYRDANGDGILQPATDTFLGYGTNNSGTWTFTFDTTGLAPGSHTLFAQAKEMSGVLCNPLAVSLTVTV